jgi:hypothetical protein
MTLDECLRRAAPEVTRLFVEGGPLREVVARARDDTEAAFDGSVLHALAMLRSEDLRFYEFLRDQLQAARVPITALEGLIEKANGERLANKKQADILIELANAAELFHTPDRTGFADMNINGHRETWPIRSKGFRHWLARRYYEERRGAPSSEALQSALNVIEAKAHFDAVERIVHVRIGGAEGRVYLDLGDGLWRAIEISPDGWQVVSTPPVRFRRAAGMLPLPVPVSGGSIEELRPFLNVQTDNDFVLAVAFPLAALHDRGPYPVLDLSGEQGSAKSTTARVLRALIDPNTAPLRALPRDERDLSIAANNGHMLAFDNVSGLPQWISDALCRLATGGGFATRQLHTDQDEVLFAGIKPVMLNGIEDTVNRPDLGDRTVFLILEPIREERRRPEQKFWAEFEQNRPRILGALLDAVAHGLRRLPDVHLDRPPRMADFARWITACETAFWPAGTFMRAYSGNLDDAVASIIEADPISIAVLSLMSARTEWDGMASDLLNALTKTMSERAANSKTWPKSPRALSGRVRRAATSLRKIGIEITFEKDQDRNRSRRIRIQKIEGANRPDRPHSPDLSNINRSGADGHADDGPAATVRSRPLQSHGMDDLDGADANFPRESAERHHDATATGRPGTTP